MTINISEEKEMELQQIYSMTVEEKFQYIKDKGHIIDPHELDIFFQFENPDKPTKSELRTLDLIVGEIFFFLGNDFIALSRTYPTNLFIFFLRF